MPSSDRRAIGGTTLDDFAWASPPPPCARLTWLDFVPTTRLAVPHYAVVPSQLTLTLTLTLNPRHPQTHTRSTFAPLPTRTSHSSGSHHISYEASPSLAHHDGGSRLCRRRRGPLSLRQRGRRGRFPEQPQRGRVDGASDARGIGRARHRPSRTPPCCCRRRRIWKAPQQSWQQQQ